MTHRKLTALRNLAERPGTEAEGILAREILARVEAKRKGDYPEDEADVWVAFEDLLRGTNSTTEFSEVLRQWSSGATWTCACGFRAKVGQKCWNLNDVHGNIQRSIRNKFAKGERVFYNYRAYVENDPAVVVGYVRPEPENGSHPWAWITLKFSRLKNARQVPIYSAAGWHLSKDPLPPDECERLIHAK